jgi:phosphoglycolate phosphatase-like HAD superfamily hydrolase
VTEKPLSSWRDTATRVAILDFVERVTTKGGSDHIPASERIAAFDNDGTLWCEKPLPIQADFLFRRLAEMAASDPSLASREPWKAVVEKRYDWLGAAITKHYGGDDSELEVLAGGLLQAYAGSTIEDFETAVADFLGEARHPTLDRPYLQCAYQPMVELLHYLHKNDFACYVASGGSRDFMRPVTEGLYGVAPDRVIGSTVALEYRGDGHGSGTIVHKPEIELFDDGPAKPVRIWSRTGRRPVVAGGNANGDIEMLEFAGTAARPALRLLVLHDDAEREFDYIEGAEKALSEASRRNWTVVSVKSDWACVFADEGTS